MDDSIEALERLKYLGVQLNSNGTEDVEIHNRIIAANKVYF